MVVLVVRVGMHDYYFIARHIHMTAPVEDDDAFLYGEPQSEPAAPAATQEDAGVKETDQQAAAEAAAESSGEDDSDSVRLR